jgi:hypothetical protein
MVISRRHSTSRSNLHAMKQLIAVVAAMAQGRDYPARPHRSAHAPASIGVHWEDELLETTPGQAPLHGGWNALVASNAGFTTCRDMGPTWPFSDIWN